MSRIERPEALAQFAESARRGGREGVAGLTATEATAPVPAEPRMPIEPQSIELHKCYRTECGEVRLVTKIEGENITFASRGPRYYLDWHETASRRVVLREWFAADAVEEVPYFWERHPTSALA